MAAALSAGLRPAALVSNVKVRTGWPCAVALTTCASDFEAWPALDQDAGWPCAVALTTCAAVLARLMATGPPNCEKSSELFVPPGGSIRSLPNWLPANLNVVPPVLATNESLPPPATSVAGPEPPASVSLPPPAVISLGP